MEKLFYDAKDIAKITGYSLVKAYDIIKKINYELKIENEKLPEREKRMIFDGRVSKSIANKKLGIN